MQPSGWSRIYRPGAERLQQNFKVTPMPFRNWNSRVVKFKI